MVSVYVAKDGCCGNCGIPLEGASVIAENKGSKLVECSNCRSPVKITKPESEAESWNRSWKHWGFSRNTES